MGSAGNQLPLLDMERGAVVLVAALVVLASANNSAMMADNAADGVLELGAEELGLSMLQLGEEPKHIVVPVQEGAAKAPDPTIETLLPKHLAHRTEKFAERNGGRQPDEMEKYEVKRLSVQAAADEINEQQQTKGALEVAKMKEKKLMRRIKRDKETIDKVSSNEEYAARKAYEAADRKVRFLESKANRRAYDAEEALLKAKKEKHDTVDAYTKRLKAKKMVMEHRAELVKEQTKVDNDNSAIMKANTILAKANTEVEDSRSTVKKKTTFLDNIEAHEANARLEYRQAKIQKEFEEDDARKVAVLLKRLSAKKDAVFKFTKSLEKKAQRDFRAAEAGIEKAKGDYANAKSNYDKYTKKAGKFEKKLKEALKLVELSKKGVVMGVNQGRDSQAIKAAENYARMKKSTNKDRIKVDKANMEAKGQNKLMAAAMAELAQSEQLETVARKQKDMVKQHKMTMRSQVEK